MKIDKTTSSITGRLVRDDPAPAVRKTAGDGQATPSRDPVQLSTLSAQLLSIQRGIDDTPVIDTARIAELKEAISSGHFRVDADKVADRLLQTVQDLIAAHRTPGY